jgi:hypothetical protein
MARVALLCPDLLFGSKVSSALQAAGHEVVPVTEPAAAADAELLILDLTADSSERIEAFRAARKRPPTLAFYSHVEQDVRRAAEAAGIDRVVPRSRMAREGAALRCSASGCCAT